ncbi:MAG: hypothetical protein H6737_30970 [Alphaproteobacteria bacterium]|nr:hypothetical protein [Alphaproteobacteria bacterium]
MANGRVVLALGFMVLVGLFGTVTGGATTVMNQLPAQMTCAEVGQNGLGLRTAVVLTQCETNPMHTYVVENRLTHRQKETLYGLTPLDGTPAPPVFVQIDEDGGDFDPGATSHVLYRGLFSTSDNSDRLRSELGAEATVLSPTSDGPFAFVVGLGLTVLCSLGLRSQLRRR